MSCEGEQSNPIKYIRSLSYIHLTYYSESTSQVNQQRSDTSILHCAKENEE